MARIYILSLSFLLFLSMFLFSACGQEKAYSGEMKEDRPHGSGTLLYPGGATYEGQFNMGKRCGEGAWYHPSGIYYEGQWQDDLYHGFGILSVPDRFTYKGEFKAGQKHGQGTKIWDDGRQYEGQWKKGRPHGEGVMFYPDGSLYEGQWKEGFRHGEGTLYDADGEIITAEWVDGELEYIPVEIISLDQSELTLDLNDDPVELTAALYPEDASDPEISWSSGNPEVATVEEGLVTPEGPGETTITATAKAEELSYGCRVTVVEPQPAIEEPESPEEPEFPIEKISIEQPWLNMRLNDDPEQIQVSVEPPGTDSQFLTWSSSNPEVAAVNQEGLVTPLAAGETEITVQGVASEAEDTIRVTVREALGFGD